MSGNEYKVAVYCSAADGLPADWIETARAVGRWIGLTGSMLVYGGVDAGLMTEVAKAVKECGQGTITGVVPMLRSDMASPLNDVEIPTEGLADRKANMCRLADVFVVLPGGYGTLDEYFSTLAYIRFNRLESKHIIMYNPDGLYDSLISQFDRLIDKGLMDARCLDSVSVVTDVDGLIGCLERFKQTTI